MDNREARTYVLDIARQIHHSINIGFNLLGLRGHLQTDFGTLNVIMTLTSDPPSLTSHYENNALAIEALNVIFFT